MATESDTQQRRGKKEQAEKKLSVKDQLDGAAAALMKNRAAMIVLHAQWRLALLRLSYLLIIMTFYQASGPSRACLKDVKNVNEYLSEDDRISGAKAALLVVSDSMVPLASVAMAGALAFFLNLKDPPADFSHRYYMIANACIPVILALHFNRQSFGCADEFLAKAKMEPEERTRGFPVVLVLHVIVTLCCSFMNMQMNQQEKNEKLVAKLRKDLEEAQAENKRKTKK